jgi:hypothetical protein
MIRRVLLAVSVCLVSSLCGAAETLVVSAGGTFNAGTPTHTWETPGAAWSISFDIDSKPSVTSPLLGFGFDVPVSNFVYTLNGSVINVGPVDVYYLGASADEGLAICFFGCTATINYAPLINEGFYFAVDPQSLYSGLESNPTVLAGSCASYLATRDGSIPPPVFFTFEPNTTITVSDLTSAPEPSTCGYLFAGVALMALVRRRVSVRSPRA